MLAEEGLAALRLADAGAEGRLAVARFFAECLAVEAPALERAIVEGSGGLAGVEAAFAA
jgi:hypothetical protein